MKVGLLADVHANKYGLSAALKYFKANGINRIYCAGDITGYYPHVNEVFALLEKNKVEFVLGNHDYYLLSGKVPRNPIVQASVEFTRKEIDAKNLKLLQQKSPMLKASLNGKKIYVVHAHPKEPFETYVYPDYGGFGEFRNVDADFIILGHTHIPMVKLAGGKKIINPGSCGQPRDGSKKISFAALNLDTGEVEFIKRSIDRDSLLQDCKKKHIDLAVVNRYF